MKYKNLFYFTHINKIGGVESFYWYLAQKYHDKDIVIVYKIGDDRQIARLKKLVRVIRFTGQRLECEKAFFNYTTDIIDYVDADEYIQILHGDYKAFGITPYIHPKIQKRIGVSQLVCDTFEEITGEHCERVYNPIVPGQPRKMLNLLSATRLTKEKGRDRMEKLGRMLDANGIPYTWTIFTDNTNEIQNENIMYRSPTLNIIDHIANADYLVQLSDCEGYCYSVAEALIVGTPVIVTDCPVFREIGVQDGVNGFILDFNLDNVPIDRIYKGIRKKFVYDPIPDGWGEILAPGESQYKKDLATIVEVEITKRYHDIQLGYIMQQGEKVRMNKVRAEIVVDAGYGRYAEVQDENS